MGDSPSQSAERARPPAPGEPINGWPAGDVDVGEIAQMLTHAGEALVISDGSNVYANERLTAIAGWVPSETASVGAWAALIMPPPGSPADARRFVTFCARPDGESIRIAVEIVPARLWPQTQGILALVRPIAEPAYDATAMLAPALILHEALKHILAHSKLEIAERVALGRALARIGSGTTRTLHYLERARAIGLGDLRQHAIVDGFIDFTAPHTIEHRPTSATTCDLTLGFLMGSLEIEVPDSDVKGTELTCASRGDAECRFRMRATRRAE